MSGKTRNFRRCECPGLDDEIDRIYNQIENIDVDSKPDALQSGASPFSNIVVGHDKDSVGIENILTFHSLAFPNLDIVAGASGEIDFSASLPASLKDIIRGGMVLGYLSEGLASVEYDHAAASWGTSLVFGNFIPRWEVKYDDAADMAGTLVCRCFNLKAAPGTIRIKAGTASVMAFIPARL